MYPILFHLGPLQVHSYGVMLMLAFLAGILLSRRQARRLGVNPDVPVDLGVWILVASVVLARLLFVALDWHSYAARPMAIWQVWREGGLSFFGGLLGGVLASALYARRANLSYWLVADVMTPGLALGYGIARIGCFLNGCCYGGPANPHRIPWAFSFPTGGESSAATTGPVHPTQLYAALGSFLLLAILLWLQPRLKARGQLFLSYLALYAVLLSFVEIFRKGATAQVIFDGITQAQFACAFIFLAALVLFIWFGRNPMRQGAGARGRQADPRPAARSPKP